MKAQAMPKATRMASTRRKSMSPQEGPVWVAWESSACEELRESAIKFSVRRAGAENGRAGTGAGET